MQCLGAGGNKRMQVLGIRLVSCSSKGRVIAYGCLIRMKEACKEALVDVCKGATK
jgi:hypothetical protein